MRRTNIALTGVWLLLYALILLGMPNPATLLVAASVAYLVYYLAVSLMLTARQHRGGGSSRSGSTSAHVAAASAGS
jgi:phosphatidylcholine synthase